MHGQGLMVPVVGRLSAVPGEDGLPLHLLLEAEDRHTHLGLARSTDERTPEERAAAAAERAARRAERGGDGPTDTPPAETFAAQQPGSDLAIAHDDAGLQDLTPIVEEPFAADALPPVRPAAAPSPRSVSAMAARASRRPRRPPPPRRTPPPRRQPRQGGHGRRRFAALLALAAARRGAVRAQRDLPAVPRRGGEAPSQVTVPAGANAGASATLLEERGVVDSARSSRSTRPSPAAAASCAPATTRCCRG